MKDVLVSMFDATASVEAMGRSPTDPEGRPASIPVRLRLGKKCQPGFLSTWPGGRVLVSITQPEYKKSNLTRILVTVRAGIRNSLDGAYPDPPAKVLRVQRRKRGDLQLRLPLPSAWSLEHPYPLGVWQGSVSIRREGPPGAYLVLVGLTHNVRPRQEIYVPRKFEEKPLPQIIVPGEARRAGKETGIEPGE